MKVSWLAVLLVCVAGPVTWAQSGTSPFGATVGDRCLADVLAGMSSPTSLHESPASRASVTTLFDERTGQIVEPLRMRGLTRGGPTRGGFEPLTRGGPRTRGGFRGISTEPPVVPELSAKVRALGLELSLAANEDAPRISKFIAEQRREFGVDSSTQELSALDGDLGDLHGSYESNRGQFLVVKGRDGEILGTAALYKLDDRTAEVRKFYLSPKLRAEGLGRLLFTQLLTRAQELRYPRIELETYASMTDAIQFYTFHGFKRFYPKRIAGEPGVNAYYLNLDYPRPTVAETPVQARYRQKWEQTQSKEFVAHLEKDEANKGKFSRDVFNKFLLEDKRNGTPQSHWYDRLGVGVSETRVRLPEQREAIDAYSEVLQERGSSPEDSFFPAITMRREVRPGIYEYRTFNPSLEAFPEEEGFEIVDRLPDPVFEQAVRRGLLPFSNFHDLHHFIAMLENPDFATALREGLRRFDGVPLDKMHRRRINYALESLSLANPKKLDQIYALLHVPAAKVAFSKAQTRLRLPITIGEFRSAYGRMSSADLEAQAHRMSQGYNSMLSTYSGAAMSSTETGLEIAQLQKTARGDLKAFVEGFDRPKAYNDALDLPRESFDEDPVLFATRMNLLLEAAHSAQLPEQTRQAALVALRDHMARMEYFLWTSATQMDVKKWTADLVTPFPNRASGGPSGNNTLGFIHDAFGENSVTYRMMNGP